MITMRKSTHGFVSHIWGAYWAPLGGPSGRRSSAIKEKEKISPSFRSVLYPKFKILVEMRCRTNLQPAQYRAAMS